MEQPRYEAPKPEPIDNILKGYEGTFGDIVKNVMGFTPETLPGYGRISSLATRGPEVSEEFLSGALAPTRTSLMRQLPGAQARVGDIFAKAGTFFGSPHAEAQGTLQENVLNTLVGQEGALRAQEFTRQGEESTRAAEELNRLGMLPVSLQAALMPQLRAPIGAAGPTAFGPSPLESTGGFLGAIAPLVVK